MLQYEDKIYHYYTFIKIKITINYKNNNSGIITKIIPLLYFYIV